MAQSLDSLFNPRSIAVIGATPRKDAVGNAIFSNILLNGYAGVIYPVNPNRESVMGVRCYKDVFEIPQNDIDLSIVIVPNTIVPKAIDDCGRKGVKAAVVVSAGFKETGKEGLALERETVELAAKYGMALLGPNCLGFINTDPEVSLNASFARTMPPAGGIAFLSQSGALCTSVLDYARQKKIGFSKFISMGNKAVLNELDLLCALRDDPHTTVILMYLEDLVSGREFIKLAREITGEIQSPKPILAIKSGRTPQGAIAASSHTGSLMGSDEVYDAIFAQSGVLRVDSIEELFDYGIAFASQPLPAGRRVAIVTNAGGPGIMTTDACIRYGLELAAFDTNTLSGLKQKLPTTASCSNPVDVIGDAKADRYKVALDAVLKDNNVDGVIVILTPVAMTDIEDIANTIVSFVSGTKKPLLCSFMGVVDVSKGVEILEANKIPHYPFPEAPARAMAALANYREWIMRPRSEVKLFDADKANVEKIILKAYSENRVILSSIEAQECLAAYGLPILRSAFAKDCQEAAGLMKAEMRFPVAAKIVAEGVVHKIDVGGVRLNLRTERELIDGIEDMLKEVRAKIPNVNILGIHLQEMAKKGKEVILGMKKDPHFGPILMFGLGGIYVEALRDVTFRLCPIRERGAVKMIRSIRAFSILEGVRGEAPSDIEAISDCLERLSQFAMDFEQFQELDINPLIVYEKGKGCAVVDARLILDKEKMPLVEAFKKKFSVI